MDISFLHIGMTKTATTYMQNVWLNDPFYCLSFKGNYSLLDDIRKAAKNGFSKLSGQANINIDKAYQLGQKLIITNEGFSTAYLNEISEQEKIPAFIELSSNSLGKLLPNCNNLLLVVRDPIAWIKSIYQQSIKQGNYGDCQMFVEEQEAFLFHSLDMRNLIDCYGRNFSNILILPFELFQNDEKAFWECLRVNFDVPVPSQSLSRANEGFADNEVFLLSALNQLSRFLFDTLLTSKNYNIVREKQILSQNYLENGKWVHRRFVEFASEEQIKEAFSLLKLTAPPETFFDFTLNDRLETKIRNDFIGFLRQSTWVDEAYIEQYESNLNLFIEETRNSYNN